MFKDVEGNVCFFHLVLALHEWLDHTIIARACVHKERAAHFIWFHYRPENECLPACDHGRDISLLKPGLFLGLHAKACKVSLALCSEDFLQLGDNGSDTFFWIHTAKKAASHNSAGNPVGASS